VTLGGFGRTVSSFSSRSHSATTRVDSSPCAEEPRFRATVGNCPDGLAAAAHILGPSGCSGRQVFLNVAVYFDVAWTTMVWIAGPRSDQDMNAYDRFPMVWLEAPIVWVEF